jgi:hypothetical protein
VKRPRRGRASARKWGLSVIWLFACPEQPALTAAPSPAPTVNLTVIKVEAGAVLSLGPSGFPGITPAIPNRDAITEGTWRANR